MKRLIQILVIGALVVVLTTLASAQVPQMINYQGKLTTSSGAPVNDTLQMVFTIYDSVGTSLWTETQDSVVVEKGVFNVLLGSVNSIPDSVFNGSVRYLGVKVAGDPEITPRKPMVSVAYAYTDGDWTIEGDNVNRLQGNVGIGTTSPTYKLDVSGDVRITGNLYAGVWQKIHETDLTTASDYTVSGLDGNNDKIYMIMLEGHIISGGPDRIIGIRPNGATSSYARGTQHVFERGGAINFLNVACWGGGTEAILPLGRNGWNADGDIFMKGYMNATTGTARMIRSEWTFIRGGYTDFTIGGSAQNSWLDSTTNIVSLTVHFDGASDFDGKLIIFALR